MSREFDADSENEDGMGATFPDNSMFHNLVGEQSQLNVSDVNGGGNGHFPFTGDGDGQLDTWPSYPGAGDSPLFHEEFPPPSTTTAHFYTPRYPSGELSVVPETTLQDPQQTDFSADQVEKCTNEDNVPTPHSSDLSNFPSIAPAPASSHIVRRRLPTSHRTHASGSKTDHFDHVQGGQHDASAAVGYGSSRRKGRTGPRPSGSSTSSVTSAPRRYHPYAGPDGYTEPGHGKSSLSPLEPARPVGLQPVPSGSSHQRLSPQEYDLRWDLLQDQSWLKNQTEEPPITDTDVFLIREYIGANDRTRFSAFVWTSAFPKRSGCRIPHDTTAEGEAVPCTYNAANAKDAIAHVALFFGYKGYKCQSTEPGHPCDKSYPTRERRNDHHSKTRTDPDPANSCSFCNKTTLARNMRRHETKNCKHNAAAQPQ